MQNVCVLVGGLDSAVLAADFASRGVNVHPLYIEEGCRWEPAERRSLERFFLRLPVHLRPRPVTLLRLPHGPLLSRHWSQRKSMRVPGTAAPDAAVEIPGRNLGLLTLGGLYCTLHRIEYLALGLLRSNPFPDGRPKFFRALERALYLGTGARVRILTPYRRFDKSRVIRKGRAWPLHLTLSCLNPRGPRHCGRCNKCRERQIGFREAGIPDFTHYSR